MKNLLACLIPLLRGVIHPILALAVVLSVAPLTAVGESDGRNSVMPEPDINLEQPFVLTIVLHDKRKAATDAKELAKLVGAAIIRENPLTAMYWLRLPTKSLIEAGTMMDKLEADPRVFKVKWDIL